MSELACLQEQFQQFLLSGHHDVYASIRQTALVSADTRLGIYRDGYKLRLSECLAANFPALHTYLGSEQFNALAAHYINTYPSSFRSIRWYGHLLPELMKNQYAHYRYLAELADFEWKMSLAFDASDAAVVQVEDMAMVPPDAWAELQFTLHPSLQRMDYVCNSVALWQALTNEQQLTQIQQNLEPVAWVLWRKPGYIIQFYSLSAEEAWALDRLLQGCSFGALCEGLCQWINPEEVGMRAASYLKGWIQNGMIARLSFPE